MENMNVLSDNAYQSSRTSCFVNDSRFGLRPQKYEYLYICIFVQNVLSNRCLFKEG